MAGFFNLGNFMKTIVYVDGFNLYYRALKKTPYKWLNILELCKYLLPKDHQIVGINYYTALVNHKIKPTAPRDQKIYLNALTSTGKVEIHTGTFSYKDKKAKIANPLYLEPIPTTCDINPPPKFIKITSAEEKGSDVKLGAHLVRDGFQGKYDCAVVITNDSDLAEPIRIIKEELKLPIILLKPCSVALQNLDSKASKIIYISEDSLKASQFPATINGKIKKPADW